MIIDDDIDHVFKYKFDLASEPASIVAHRSVTQWESHGNFDEFFSSLLQKGNANKRTVYYLLNSTESKHCDTNTGNSQSNGSTNAITSETGRNNLDNYTNHDIDN